jgi:trimethylamine--corrinoid protein Co-methyltransferase
MGAIAEVGPGGHYLGCAHTQANFKRSFWKSGLLDYKPFETWSEDGAPDTMTLAAAKAQRMLSEYRQPTLDPAIDEALQAYIAGRKAGEPDAFG